MLFYIQLITVCKEVQAAKYYIEHKELGLTKAAENLGVSKTTLGVWGKAARENNGAVPTRGSGNFQSDESKGDCSS